MSEDKEMREAFEDYLRTRNYGSFTTRELLWPVWQAAWSTRVSSVDTFGIVRMKRAIWGAYNLAPIGLPTSERMDWMAEYVIQDMRHFKSVSSATTSRGSDVCLSQDQKRAIAQHVHGWCSRLPGANFYSAAESAIDKTLAAIDAARQEKG